MRTRPARSKKRTIVFSTFLVFAALVAARGWTVNDACPNRIHASVPGITIAGERKDEPRFDTMASIHSAMKTCPGITTLEVRVDLFGCSEWPDRWNFDFDPAGGDHYLSAPEVLSLDGYRFDDRPRHVVHPPDKTLNSSEWEWWTRFGDVWSWFQWRRLLGAQQSKSNLELWLDAMDFSRIHTLSFNYSVDKIVNEKLPSHLTNLQSLGVSGSKGIDFIRSLPVDSLKQLRWRQPGATSQLQNDTDGSEKHIHILREVLEGQGASLETLEWRNDEMSWSGGPTPAFSVEDINMLAEKARHLASLTLVIDRNGSWPWEAFQALAMLPKLQNLTIYMDMQSQCRREKPGYRYSIQPEEWKCKCLGADQYQTPVVGSREGHDVVKYLRKHKVGVQFEHITIRSGDWTPPWDGPLYSPPWLEGQRAWYDCTFHKIDESIIYDCEHQETQIHMDQDFFCRETAGAPDSGSVHEEL